MATQNTHNSIYQHMDDMTPCTKYNLTDQIQNILLTTTTL